MIQQIAVLAPLFVSLQWALVLLLRGNSSNQARFWLGLFMVIAFMLYLGHAVFFMGWFRTYIDYDPIYTSSSLMVFPMYYFYIRLLTKDTKWQRHYLVHFIPALLFGSGSLLLQMINHDDPHMNPASYMDDSITSLAKWNNPFIVFYFFKRLVYTAQVISYLWLGTRLIRNYHDRVRNFYSSMGDRDIKWVSALNFTLVFTAFISLIFNAIGRSYFFDHPAFLLFPSFLFTLVLFVIGYLGNAQAQPSVDLETEISKEAAEASEIKWVENELKEKLERLFEDKKIYTNSELTIWDVAAHLNSNRTYVSNLINEEYGMNFSRYVNQFRVEEAKRLLQLQDSWKLSLDTIGEQCGFGSLNNFIRTFRSFTNTTPGRYREEFLMQGKTALQ